MGRKTKVGYVLAGLDFVFDEKGNPWFIEGNTVPAALLYYEQVNGNLKPLEELARYMKRHGKNPCILTKYGKNTEYRRRDRWFYGKMKQYLPNLRFCFTEKNMGRKKKLIDVNHVEFEPSCILSRSHAAEKITAHFEKKIPVINPNPINMLVTNKLETIKVLKRYTSDVKIPRTFFVKNNKEFKVLMRENPEFFERGYVVKPLNDSCGHGVHVFSHDEKFRIRRPELLEQRIKPKLKHRRYWDVRVFVVNGKFMGGVMRESLRRVTNISTGAKAYKIPKSILKKLKKPSENIVRAINRAVS